MCMVRFTVILNHSSKGYGYSLAKRCHSKKQQFFDTIYERRWLHETFVYLISQAVFCA